MKFQKTYCSQCGGEFGAGDEGFSSCADHKKENRMKHKHADLIHAWADGAQIQFRLWGGMEWIDTEIPAWEIKYEYRIKPEEKQPVVRWLWAKQVDGYWQISCVYRSKEEALKVFNGQFICLEYTRKEFPE
jgi:hypothetical protein